MGALHRKRGRELEHLIGIKKLPDVAGKLSPGRLYVVMHDAGLGLEVACRTMVAACAAGRVEWIAEDPSAYLGLPRELEREVAGCLQEGDLRVFRAKAGERRGMGRTMLKELDFLGAARDSLIVVEGTDRFLERDTPEMWAEGVAAWQHWTEQSGCTVLWMCPLRSGQPGHEAEFLRLGHRFSGLARLRRSGDEVRWDVHYWFAGEGLMADKSFRLESDGDGNWGVRERDTLNAGAAEPAVDEDDVFITRAALPGDRSVPAGWRVFETVDQMNLALSSARAPTAVFHYHAGSSLETLARSIFELRRLVGPCIKIAVKEVGGRLRHSHEQLLLSMGANLTIPGETGFARMQSLLKSIQGQVYSRALPSSFEEAMAGVMAVSHMGYLAPTDFRDKVADVMERTQPLEVHNALVRLSVTPGLSVQETLRCCTMKRPGDLCTADDESVYVFLFACEEQDISATLDRLFRLPVSVLFSAESRFLSAGDIADAIEEFGQRAAEAKYTDFTSALAERSVEKTEPAGKAVAEAKGRAPFTAVPRALTLRVASI